MSTLIERERVSLHFAARNIDDLWTDKNGYRRQRGYCAVCLKLKDCYINGHDLRPYCTSHIAGLNKMRTL